MQHIYLAGPYTKGDPVINTAQTVDVADQLLDKGYSPYIPHLTMFWHYRHPHSWEEWLTFDESWILKCDALIRLEGESAGADREVEFARANNIPVFFGLQEFYEHTGIADGAFNRG